MLSVRMFQQDPLNVQNDKHGTLSRFDKHLVAFIQRNPRIVD
jgi:hypothetical protein